MESLNKNDTSFQKVNKSISLFRSLTMKKLIQFIVAVLLLSMACDHPVRNPYVDELLETRTIWQQKSDDS